MDSEVLARVKLNPDEHAAVMERIESFIWTLKKLTKRLGVRIVLGGSAAKGTLIKGDFDCDVFVCFKRGSKDISRTLERAIRSIKPESVHGSRDYFRKDVEGIVFEIVPVLDIRKPEQAENVTDMSPLHVGWISSRIRKSTGLRDQIILAKQFCKVQGVYGAESYIGGFSGHVIDILLVRYNSFRSLLKASIKWKTGTIIDVEKHGTARQLNKSKYSPLILIDPVDPMRNAAAALTIEKFERFREAASQFLKSPSLGFFEKKKIDIASLRRTAGKRPIMIVKAYPLEGKTDVVGAKLMKAHHHILDGLKSGGFTLLAQGWAWERSGPALMWYVMKERALPARRLHWGPPAGSDQAPVFRKLYPGTTISGGRLLAYVKREHTTSASLIRSILKESYVRERVKKAQYLY
jgi:tRNA nucleotidyltransferase (CCA-adding enzyme)